MALLVQQMTEKPAALPSSVPRQISRLVMSLLEKKPERRPQTADEVVARLAEILGMPAPGPHGSALGLPAPPPITRTGVRPGSMAAIVTEQVAEQVAKVGPAIEAAVEASGPAVSYLRQSMTVKGMTFPRWVPAAGVLGFVVVLLVLMASGDEEETDGARASGPAGTPGSQQAAAETP